ncbi:MAG: polyprenyl diphosphate synthase [Candidatus Altiarchaeota archaeon]
MHVALIPDGNRRYMKKKGILNLGESYASGIKQFYDFLQWCSDFGVDEVTIYALSTENIENRSNDEIKTLFNVFAKQAGEAVSDRRIHDNKVKVNFCGDKEYLLNGVQEPDLAKKLVENLGKLEDATRDYGDLTLNLAIAYGGRQEILSAAEKISESGLPFTEDNLKANLWVKGYPDILIRTSEDRLSNFLLWQAAYSEMYFPDKLWQEFTKDDLEKIILDYRGRERRFGK